jgi:hypothetical protein
MIFHDGLRIWTSLGMVATPVIHICKWTLLDHDVQSVHVQPMTRSGMPVLSLNSGVGTSTCSEGRSICMLVEGGVTIVFNSPID